MPCPILYRQFSDGLTPEERKSAQRNSDRIDKELAREAKNLLNTAEPRQILLLGTL